jgi:trehalose-6-phosphate synthase
LRRNKKDSKADDIFWVHDYQLMLLPGMLREAFPDATIGYFLHIPFLPMKYSVRFPGAKKFCRES